MNRAIRAIMVGTMAAATWSAAGAQEPDRPATLRHAEWIGRVREMTVTGTFKASDGTELPYRLFRSAAARENEGTARWPLILCLHAAGGRGTDNMGHLRGSQAFLFFAQESMQEKFPCFLVAPQCPDGRRWVATPWKKGSYSVDALAMTPELACADELVDWICRTEPVDPDRLYLAGQSMGGFGVFDLLVRRPEKYAAAIISCGAADPSKAAILREVPLWFFHGEDDATVPYAASVELDAALRAVGGARHRFTTFAGVGHTAYENTFEVEGLAEWLFAQRRNAPRRDTSAPVAPIAGADERP